MAIGAHGGDGQSALHQTFPVDTLSISLNDLMLPAGISHGGFLSFSMTAGAEVGYVRGKDYRAWVNFPSHTMRAVTFLARWSIGIVFRHKNAMRARLKLLTNLGMAGGTVYLLRNRLAWPHTRGIDPGMTLTAGNPCMS